MPFDDVELAEGGVALRAVGELAGQCARFEQALALHQVARFASGFACTRCGQRLLDDATPVGRALLEILREAFGQGDRHVSLHLCVAQLALGLAFELRLEDLDADYGGVALPPNISPKVSSRPSCRGGLLR